MEIRLDQVKDYIGSKDATICCSTQKEWDYVRLLDGDEDKIPSHMFSVDHCLSIGNKDRFTHASLHYYQTMGYTTIRLKREKSMKVEERNYLMINKDNEIVDTLKTKKEVLEHASASSYEVIDISNAPRYNKVTTSRMVLQKPAKVAKKKGVK